MAFASCQHHASKGISCELESQVPRREPAHSQAVDPVEREAPRCIVRARKLQNFVRQIQLAEALQHLLRIHGKEAGIVRRPHQQALELPAAKTFQVRCRADYRPEAPEIILRHLFTESAADVLRGYAGPHHIREIHRNVVEDADAYTRIVSRGNAGNTGTEAGAENSQTRVALLL